MSSLGDLISEGPTIVGVEPWGVHVVGTLGDLMIFIRQRACYRFGLDPSNEVSIPMLLI